MCQCVDAAHSLSEAPRGFAMCASILWSARDPGQAFSSLMGTHLGLLLKCSLCIFDKRPDDTNTAPSQPPLT